MYDLEEQEKLDALKGWWHENRLSVLAVIAAGVLAYGGVNGWKAWKGNQAEKAAAQYLTFQQAVAAAGSDVAKVDVAAKAIEAAVPSSPYASRAALLAAQALAGADKTNEARIEYQWVIDHSEETQVQSIARIRLAGVLADAKKFDDALALLSSGVDPAFASYAGDRRGDILLAQGKSQDARAAYKAALDATEQSSPLRTSLQTKLDALGAEAAAAPGLAAGSGDSTSADAKAADAKPADAKPADAKVPDVKSADAKVPDTKPADAKPSEATPSDPKTADAKAAGKGGAQ